MKYILFAVAGLLYANLATAQSQVKGTVKGADGKTLYLFNDEDNTPDDSTVIKNNAFSFQLKAAKTPSVYALILSGTDFPMLFVPGEGTTELHTEINKFPVATTIKGTEDTKAMQAYQQAFQPLIKRAQALNAEAAGIKEDDEPGKATFRKKAEAFNNDVISTGKEFIKANPKRLASLWLLINELRSRLEPADFEALFNGLDRSLQESKYGKGITAYIKSLRANNVGIMADDFAQYDPAGKLIKLSSFRGKYVLVDFWASWCGPCRQENPNVVKAYQQYKNKNFAILGVSLDNDKSRWLHAVEKDGLEWTQVSDLRGWGNEVAVQYGIQSIPANFLVDPDGKIIARNLRGSALEARLAQIFK
ncbi:MULTISPECIES: TlpA disulfide reductase family protein [Chitinophaga]|uniref:TlpA disulfide reductase family protein n=1 Tax=Chitinophaga TaxID=79328 RepID=UPI000BB04923|nr:MULTISPECIES: TlpA disulfide reductase family protein [Chitinophaga]ASZ11434.1 alkyl hydroperoxide reductase [Chitinophaga sp. MD30]